MWNDYFGGGGGGMWEGEKYKLDVTLLFSNKKKHIVTEIGIWIQNSDNYIYRSRQKPSIC